MTHTCNLRTWAAEARELLQIWGQLGLPRECPTTLDHMWSKALPLWCGIVNKEDSSPRCACHAPSHYSLVGVALPPERNPFQLGRSTAGALGGWLFQSHLRSPSSSPLCFGKASVKTPFDLNILNKAFSRECWICCSAVTLSLGPGSFQCTPVSQSSSVAGSVRLPQLGLFNHSPLKVLCHFPVFFPVIDIAAMGIVYMPM